MILLYVPQPAADFQSHLQAAATLASRFQKSLALLLPPGAPSPLDTDPVGSRLDTYYLDGGIARLAETCETLEASFLLVRQPETRTPNLQHILTACRPLRIPYLICSPRLLPLDPREVVVPVTFLEEEYEKAQFAAAFGRFFGSHIHLLQARDYGTRAGRTATKIAALLDKFNIDYQIEVARGDSYKVEKEAIRYAGTRQAALVLLTASRDYGLDDLIFGPKERHFLKRSSVPILLINPRGDLYSLCD